MSKRKVFVLAAGLLVLVPAGLAVADRVDQGAPGAFGAWPVTIVAGGGGTASVVQTTPQTCTTPTHKVTSVGLAAVNTPSAQLAARRFVTLTNSAENTGNPKVKCRADGVAPIMGIANPGDVLALGSSITYAVAAGVVPQCISDTAATAVTSYECS